MADVGLIGLPNAGKSTLLSMCSAARPRIAPYPFTTTDPVLGVVANRDKSFVMMEVPGLIEGAHKGAGLGHEFLRHVERARLLLHLLDVQSDDPVGDWRRINQELISFNLSLGEKPQFIVVNKVDIPEVQERVAALRGDLESLGLPLFFISAATGEGVGTLLGKTLETLDSLPQADMEVGRRAIPSIAPRVKETFRVSHENGVYVVHAPRVERLVPRANLRDRRVMLQIWQELERLGVAKALEEKGVQVGDTVRLGEMDLEWF